MAVIRMEKVALEEVETPAGTVSKSSMLEMVDEEDAATSTSSTSSDHHTIDVQHDHSHDHHSHGHHSHGHSHGDKHKPKKKHSLPKLSLQLDAQLDHHLDTPKQEEEHSRHKDLDSTSHDHSHDHHGHDHSHDHGHDHDDDNHSSAYDSSAVKKLRQACLCSAFFMCAQFAGGYYADSLAIMTDAAHLLSDVASFLVSLFAIYVGSFPANARMPFGYQRAEVLGALISVLIIWMLTLMLLYAAVLRMIAQAQPDAQQTVNGKVMFLVSSFGLGINLLLMKILGHGHSHSHGGHGHSHGHAHGNGHADKTGRIIDDGVQQSPSVHDDSFIKTPMSAVALIDVDNCAEGAGVEHSASFENINVRAAYIHALGDFIQSLGVCLAGALIWYNPSWQIADPITTILFSFLVLATTYGILTRSVLILMESAPSSLNLQILEKQLRQLEAVYDCHDLRVWSLTEGHFAVSVHIIPNGVDRSAALKAAQVFFYNLGIHTQTIQVEDPQDREWNEDMFCTWNTYSISESMMSVPRAMMSNKAAASAFD
uniref:Cation efflux protein transmembrane domain-containing protein n=1 Tax=Globisporangium ultimum (strain ATCC 200006 / CBS 805.95 / DAOM BR144) TaxID=431595 RepID=K3W5A9_GLOUD